MTEAKRLQAIIDSQNRLLDQRSDELTRLTKMYNEAESKRHKAHYDRARLRAEMHTVATVLEASEMWPELLKTLREAMRDTTP